MNYVAVTHALHLKWSFAVSCNVCNKMFVMPMINWAFTAIEWSEAHFTREADEADLSTFATSCAFLLISSFFYYSSFYNEEHM